MAYFYNRDQSNSRHSDSPSLQHSFSPLMLRGLRIGVLIVAVWRVWEPLWESKQLLLEQTQRQTMAVVQPKPKRQKQGPPPHIAKTTRSVSTSRDHYRRHGGGGGGGGGGGSSPIANSTNKTFVRSNHSKTVAAEPKEGAEEPIQSTIPIQNDNDTLVVMTSTIVPSQNWSVPGEDSTTPPVNDSVVVEAEVSASWPPQSSLERLVQLLNMSDQDNGPHHLSDCVNVPEEKGDNETNCRNEPPLSSELVYVNCAATTVKLYNDSVVTGTRTIPPRSLQQCLDLLIERNRDLWRSLPPRHSNDVPIIKNLDSVVSLVPRHDLFPFLQQPRALQATAEKDVVSSSFSLPTLEPLGQLHFHVRRTDGAGDGSNETIQSSTDRGDDPSDVEWFVNTIVPRHNVPPYYARLGRAVADAFGCQQRQDDESSSFFCPAAPINNGAVNADASDAATATWTVPNDALAPVFDIMYQFPASHRNNGKALDTATLAPEPLTLPNRHVDPATPSVAIFRKAYAEMGSGRILIHLPITKDRCDACNRRQNDTDAESNPSESLHRPVLIQMNSCYEPVEQDNLDAYAPFARDVHANTNLDESGTRVFDKAIVITSLWSVEYYHSTVESLPRLLLLRDFVESIDSQDIPIVVTSHYKWWLGTFLGYYADIWGFGHRLVFLPHYEVIYANVLYVPEPSTCLGLDPIMAQAHRAAIRNVVQQMQQREQQQAVAQALIDSKNATDNATDTTFDLGAGLEPTEGTNDANDWIIVIRRRETRFLRNHDDMMDALYAALPNETWYVFDEGNADGKFPKTGVPQWTVFALAKLVIAPHGAGLSNLLAVPPRDTHVVEFLGAGKVELCYLHMSLALGLHYHHLRMDDAYDGDKSYVVNVEHVVEVVTDIVGSI